MIMKLEESLPILKKGLLFRNLSDSEILEVIGTMSPSLREFSKRTVIAQDGEPLNRIGILLTGCVYLSHVDPDGNNNLMERLVEGEAFGLLNAVGRYKMHIGVTATEQTKVLFLEVDQLLRKHVLTAPVQIRFLQNLTLAMAHAAHRLTIRLEDSIRRPMRQKIQDYLSDEYHKSGKRTFVIPLNRQSLADFLFVDRSAMSSELCQMRDEGLLKFEKSRFELLVEMPISEEEKDPNDNEDAE